MNTTNLMAATAAVVVGGQWAFGKGLNPRIAVGAFAGAAFLSMINEVSPDLAEKFALAVFIVALFTYVPAIGVATGLIKTSAPAPGQSLKEKALA